MSDSYKAFRADALLDASVKALCENLSNRDEHDQKLLKMVTALQSHIEHVNTDADTKKNLLHTLNMFAFLAFGLDGLLKKLDELKTKEDVNSWIQKSLPRTLKQYNLRGGLTEIDLFGSYFQKNKNLFSLDAMKIGIKTYLRQGMEELWIKWSDIKKLESNKQDAAIHGLCLYFDNPKGYAKTVESFASYDIDLNKKVKAWLDYTPGKGFLGNQSDTSRATSIKLFLKTHSVEETLNILLPMFTETFIYSHYPKIKEEIDKCMDNPELEKMLNKQTLLEQKIRNLGKNKKPSDQKDIEIEISSIKKNLTKLDDAVNAQQLIIGQNIYDIFKQLPFEFILQQDEFLSLFGGKRKEIQDFLKSSFIERLIFQFYDIQYKPAPEPPSLPRDTSILNLSGVDTLFRTASTAATTQAPDATSTNDNKPSTI